MAVTLNLLTSNASGTNTSAITTPSVSPDSAQITFVVVTYLLTGARTSAPVVSGVRGSWALVSEAKMASRNHWSGLYAGTGSSGTGSITITAGGADEFDAYGYTVVDVDGISSASPTQTPVSTTALTGGTVSVAYGSAPTDGNLLLAVLSQHNNSTNITERSGWTPLTGEGSAGVLRHDVDYRLTSDTDAGGTFTDNHLILAFEFSASGGGGTLTDTWILYTSAPGYIDANTIQFGHTFKAALLSASHTLDLTNSVRADLATDIVGTDSAVTLATSADSGMTKVSITGSPSWGGSVSGRYLVIYDDTPTSPADPLLCVVDLGSAQTVGTGFTLSLATGDVFRR